MNLRCDNTKCLISRRRSILPRYKVHFSEVCFTSLTSGVFSFGKTRVMIITLFSIISWFLQKKVMIITLISNFLSVICWFPQKMSDDNHFYFNHLLIFAKKEWWQSLISNIISVICWFPQKMSDDNHSYFKHFIRDLLISTKNEWW